MTTMGPVNQYGAIGAASAVSTPTGASAIAGASLLPDPNDAVALSSDPAVALAQLAVENGNDQERVAEASRAMQEQQERSQDDLEVKAMRQKASDLRTGGIIGGVGMIVSGGAGLAGEVLPEFGSGRLAVAGKDLRAGAPLAKAVGEFGRAMKDADAASDDADATAHRAAADDARRAADDQHDAVKGASDFVSQAIDFYREYVSAKASEQSAALHRS